MTDEVALAREPRAPTRGAVAAIRGRAGLQRALAAAAALLFIVALFAACRALDQLEDRGRPMYRDVLTMAWVQYDRLREGAPVVPADLHSGAPLTDGDAHQVVSPGVRLRVIARNDGYCVRGWNQFGEDTGWVCGDGSTKPQALGALAHLD